MTHPKVLSKVFPFSLHHPQHTRHPAGAPGREARVHVGAVVPICDVDPLVPGDRVRIDGRRGGDAVLPFFLHFRVHDQQRIVREVDGYLALGIGVLGGSVVAVPREDSADTKFASHSQRYRSYDSPWAQVRELVAVPANALLRAIVAVHKRRVWGPRMWRLMSQLAASGIASLYAALDLLIDRLLDERLDLDELRGDPPNILRIHPSVRVLLYILNQD